MKYFFYFFYFINFSFILSWIILPGDSSRTNCHKLCGENGYNCYSEVFGSFSCREAAINYCNNPYIKDQMLYDPSKVYCFHGGGCFVNCAESTFLELHRINGTCSTNICDVGEFSYSIMCPCIERPTEPPHYVITMTTTEEVGTFSFLTISSFFVVWLLCCCCSIELMKKSSNRDIATDDELEYFVEKEIDPTTQCLWMLWCEPCKKGCWYGFQETKRYIYRCCCKPKPKPHLLSDSSIRRNRRNKNLNTNNQNIVSQSTSQSLQSSQSYFSWFYSLIGISSNSNNSNYDAVESELSNMENSELHDAPDQKKRISLGQLYGSHSSRLYSGDISEIDKSLSNNFTINTQSYDTLPKAENEEDISQHQKTKKVFLGELYGSQSSKLYGEKSSQSEKNPSSENYSTNSSRLSNHTANPIYSSHLSQNSPLQNTLNQPQLSSSSLLYLNKNNLQGSTKDSLLGTNRIINSTFNSNTTMGASTSSLPSSSPSSTTTTTISPLPLLSSISTSRVGNNLEGREIERNTGIESIEIVKPKKISLGEMYSSQSSKYYGNQSYSSKSSSSP